MVHQSVFRLRKLIALFFLTIFYAETLFSAYIPFRNQVTFKTSYNNVEGIKPAKVKTTASEKPLVSNLPELNANLEKAVNNKPFQPIEKKVGGPGQPEMSAFQSVNSNNMVDLFTGDFSYNIPLLDVGGYPVNLFYRSGITMDQEASWVGLGWNINPGTVTRNLRGLPDDFDGSNDAITKVTSIKKNVTTGASVGGDLEIFGLMGVGASTGAFYNNYKGWGLENSINTSVSAGFANMDRLTAGLSINNNSQEGLTLSPSMDVSLTTKDAESKQDNGSLCIGGGFAFNSRSGLRANLSSGINLSLASVKNQKHSDGLQGSLYSSSISFVTPSYVPTVSLPYTNSQYTFILKVGGEISGGHLSGFVRGYQSSQGIQGDDTLRKIGAYGYLNYQDAQGHADALLDYNREKELVYRQKPEFPNIAIPSYTYDLFSISGEGTGGMFRPYRGDIGYVYDHAITTKDNSDEFSADFGFGPNLAHAGFNVEVTHANTTGGPWVENNVMASTVAFKQSDSNYQSVYFRNPGEKSINTKEFYNAVGNDDVVTAGLYQSGSNLSTTSYLQRYNNKAFVGSSLLTPSNAYKPKRDKRTQVITYLDAEEASHAGLDKTINSYGVNEWGPALCSNAIHSEDRVGGMRKPNHLSEIDVLNADGKRYIYGLPVYNKLQDEVTYAVNKNEGNAQTGLANYSSSDDKPNNGKGKDSYYNRERTPAYAHSFLLTGILSPDYVDVKGDGITDDDLGDAIKINYTKISDSVNAFSWRSPYSDSVSYNEGLQTYNRDDKGSYIYGEKELWYMNSIESKNMVAQFILEGRSDLKPISKGGVIASNTPAKRLKEIRLFSKADLLKNGANAIPIKTVHFEYAYGLCPNPGQSNQGKLTLKKVWFTYNGNDKGIKNPYKFNYDNTNPNYDNRSFDRWGTFKDANDKPHNQLTNAEYPYALQDSIKASQNASAWTLDSISLPSGGTIKVNFESDDYAYVQNKRAMQMFNVIGLSKVIPTTSHAGGTESDLQNDLYNYQQNVDHSEDNLFIGIKVQNPVSSNLEVFTKYLEGINTLYFKLKVTMPANEWGSGAEYIPCYADIDATQSSFYGYLESDPSIIWVKIKGINITGEGGGDYSPLAKAAIQFLRLNLPSKAYPGSETTEGVGIIDAIQMIANTGKDIVSSFSSFDRQARENKWAIQIDPDRSWVRLNNPDYKKYGGGLRVKSIKIYDNWYDMTDHQQKESVYGQEYNYMLTKNIDGKDQIISSGVASYEPMLGNEENPWRLPVEYIDKIAPLAPVTMGYSETPFGESFFPAASIGYSRVTVRSINIKGVKSANGFEETKFFNTYDFPTLVDNSMLNGDTKKHFNTSLGALLRLNIKHYLAMSQGFKVELNDMNGKVRSQATYAQTDSLNPISYTENFYKVDDKNAEFKHLSNTVKTVNAQGLVDTASIIGKDIELMMDMRQQNSTTIANNYNTDLDVFVIGIFPIPVPGFLPLPQKEENMYKSTATTKIIQRYGILDSVVAIDKGSRVNTENLLYDSETGDPVLTRTRNEFNDTLYNFSYPAHWAYSGIGLAYQNINDVFGRGSASKLSIINGSLQSNSRYPGLKNYFESGDEVLVYGRGINSEDTTFDCSGTPTCISNGYSNTYNYDIVWAVDSKKVDTNSTAGLMFLQRDGTPYSGLDVSMKIIRSGHRNLTSTSLGSVTSLKTPIKKVGSQLKLVIDNTISILNSNAAIYNEKWRVKDALYLKDTTTFPQYTAYITPQITRKEYYFSNGDTGSINQSNATFAGASYEWVGKRDNKHGNCGGCHTRYIYNRSLLQFDFTTLPTGSVVQYADLSFNPKNSSSDFCSTVFNSHDIDQDCYTRDYNDIGSFYSGQSAVDLKRITAPWDATTHFDLVQTTDANKASVDFSNYSNVNCTNLIKDVYSDPTSRNYGVEFLLNDENYDSECDDEFNMLTFNTSSSSPLLFLRYTVPDNYTVCRSAITQRQVNPYVHGILGDWRADKSLVFYNSRAQSSFTASTNIRKDGTISSFVPYWSFTSSYIKATTDTTNWVWNTQTTLYNRKGFEIENKDPLGRYNSGSYGYNETLPVSVTQNSRYQQQFFDGFEDYGYSTENCPVDCALPRPMDFVSGGGVLDSTYKHSGKYSLKVQGTSQVNFSLGNINQEKFALTSKLSFADTTVTGKGDGIYASRAHFITGWDGYLQPDVSALYTIQTTTTNSLCPPDSYSLTLTSVDNPSETITVQSDPNTNVATLQHQLNIGKLYEISVDEGTCNWTDSNLNIKWSKQICSAGTLVNIPSQNLYPKIYNYQNPPTYYDFPDTSGSLHVNAQSACVRNDGFGANPKVLLPDFNPYAGDVMVVGAWVKESQDCLCDSFTHNGITAVYKDGSGNVIGQEDITPRDIIVEGWQRYDALITMPLNATSVQLQLKSTGEYDTYFDDVRLHPYNANMKSFVYDPVNLRLMAELDENNYASFYEYDDDGTLIRVKKETERGIQTIKEHVVILAVNKHET